MITRTLLAVAMLVCGSMMTANAEQTAAPAPQEQAVNYDKQVTMEAELPEGFPAVGPAGVALVKQYPQYRAASATGREAFWKLFNHIQRNNLPMTAPVEMTQPATAAQDQPADNAFTTMEVMAFLYPSTSDAQLGPDPQDPTVTVADHPAKRVVSYGFFGNPGPAPIDQANAAIDAVLAQDPTLKPAGPRKLLGYNSPMVPPPDRYYEWQQPLAE